MTFRPTLAGAACLLTLCWPAVAPWTSPATSPAATDAVQDPAAPATRRDPALAAHLDGAMKSFVGKDYLATGEQLQEAIALVRNRFETAVRDALPRSGKDHLAVDPPPPATPQAEGPAGFDPMRMMTLGVSRPIEQRYRARDGQGTLRLLVIPRTPAVRQALQTLDAAEEREDVELLEVGRHLGTLETSTYLTRARFVLDREHLIEVQGLGSPAEAVADLLDAEALDRLAAVLTPRR